MTGKAHFASTGSRPVDQTECCHVRISYAQSAQNSALSEGIAQNRPWLIEVEIDPAVASLL